MWPDTPPAAVRIWFDGQIEPVFSTIRVENQDKQRVDTGDGGVDPGDNRVLQVKVPPLPPGRYRVYWSVVARDGDVGAPARCSSLAVRVRRLVGMSATGRLSMDVAW